MSHDLKLYYDPDVVDSLSIEEISYEIEKGVLHPVLSHSQRGKFLIHDERSQKAFTHATDLVAHKFMQDSGRPIPELDSKKTFESYTLENDQGSYHLWSGSCTEEIYSQILRGLPEEDTNESPTDNDDTNTGADIKGGNVTGTESGNESGNETGEGEGQGEPTSDEGGSSQDGQPRDFEDEPTKDDLNGRGDGPSEEDYDKIRQELGDGSDSQGHEGWHPDLIPTLRKRKTGVKPYELLRRAVKARVRKYKTGTKEQTYRRPSRRFRKGDPFIRPSSVNPMPSIAVVVDTSGSMGVEDLELGQAMIELALRGMKLDEVRVISADTEIRNDQKVSDISKILLKGRGGTCMDDVVHAVLHDAPRKTHPDLVLLVTDCETNWPSDHRVPVVCCATRDNYSVDGVPDYIHTVKLFETSMYAECS